MKKIAIFMLIIGKISTIMGILSFIFAYPYSNTLNPNSGPSNGWELILILSYEGQFWYLIVGITFILLSCFLCFKKGKA